jgi:hypothetical protein
MRTRFLAATKGKHTQEGDRIRFIYAENKRLDVRCNVVKSDIYSTRTLHKDTDANGANENNNDNIPTHWDL